MHPLDPTPLLQPHYSAFFALTSWSAPVVRLGTLASRILPFVLLPYHRATGSRSSMQEPETDSRPLYAGCRLRSNQVSRRLVLENGKVPSFDNDLWITTLQRGFNFVRLSASHLLEVLLDALTPTLTTMAFVHSRLEWFRACP